MDSTYQRYQQQRIAHWDSIAREQRASPQWSGYYHRRLAQIFKFLVGPGLRILELGCGQGELLASLAPSRGVGVDFSAEMLRRASVRQPELLFVLADAHAFGIAGLFDVIILSDLIDDVWDVQAVFDQIAPLCHPRTRIIINAYSQLWQLPLGLARRLGLAKPALQQNWLTVDDARGLLNLTDFEVVRHWQEILWPLDTPVLETICNRVFVKMWPFNLGALTNFIIARPVAQPDARSAQHRVSIVIPARNEAGNIPQVFTRTPHIGHDTEFVFVEGHSSDDTYAAIERSIAANPQQRCILLRQTGVGKGDAVRLGFANATGDVLMILDADLTMPPEDLPRYYDALCTGKAEFVNGVRLVYPMEQEAMRYANLLGNKFFSLMFSWLLGQPVKDTLCGTKALMRADYNLIAANRAYFGDFDPFGDFDLLFGAARLSLKIVDMPVRYRQRTYGQTNIQRWKHGLLLLRMLVFAAKRIKFT
jgi:SAM-dependent methyltransferase